MRVIKRKGKNEKKCLLFSILYIRLIVFDDFLKFRVLCWIFLGLGGVGNMEIED